MIPFSRPLAALWLVLLAVNASSGGTPKAAPVAVPQSPATAASQAETPATNVTISVDVFSNRHPIGAYVYGGAYPKDAPTITDSGLSVVRWGGNAASTYNWNLGTDNADND